MADELEPEGELAPDLEIEEEEIPEEQDEADDEFSIELEGETAEDETPLIKELRTQLRDRDRELSEHRKAVAQKIEVGAEPTLESSDYDEDKFKADWLDWNKRTQAVANQEAEASKAAEVRNHEMQRRFTDYRAKATTLPVKDFEAAEGKVLSVLPDTPDRPFQQALLAYTKNPAHLVYALGKHPAKLDALAKEQDPIRFILALTEMERNMKVVTRKRGTEPESGSIQRGSAQNTGGVDKHAEKLLAAATRSGNMTEYSRYMKAKRKD
jgi:hypothetical protein